MSRHYSRHELSVMGIQTLLASDPVTWRAYARVVEGREEVRC